LVTIPDHTPSIVLDWRGPAKLPLTCHCPAEEREFEITLRRPFFAEIVYLPTTMASSAQATLQSK